MAKKRNGRQDAIRDIVRNKDVRTQRVLVVDACRHVVRAGEVVLSLAGRPVLFALVRVLGEAWPSDVSRDALAAKVFRARQADESYRARLRVELGRLRRLLRRGLPGLRPQQGQRQPGDSFENEAVNQGHE